MRAVVVETVHDLDEFLKLIAPESRIHYELFWRPARVFQGLIEEVEAGIIFYGFTKDGFVLKCIKCDRISWNDEKLNKYGNVDLHKAYDMWIKERWQDYQKEAKKIGATPGNFEMRVIA
jgi:hypothetical protein